MKQRLLIARSLINSPRVLFLDEPTRGLDPTSARELRALVAQLARGGDDDLPHHALHGGGRRALHRVAFLSQGKIVALDTPRELKLRYGQRTARVLLRDRTEQTVRLDDPVDAAQLEEWMRADQVLDHPFAGGHARGRLRRARRTAAVMRLPIVVTIFRKDVVDAMRDSRILVSLLTPCSSRSSTTRSSRTSGCSKRRSPTWVRRPRRWCGARGARRADGRPEAPARRAPTRGARARREQDVDVGVRAAGRRRRGGRGRAGARRSRSSSRRRGPPRSSSGLARGGLRRTRGPAAGRDAFRSSACRPARRIRASWTSSARGATSCSRRS